MVKRARLPGALLIDQKQPITFTFEGKTYQGYAGDTIASALAGAGQWVLSRSFKYHRPRGILTMAGQDSNTLVQLLGMPNVLADKTLITDGLQVEAQNYTGSLMNDKEAEISKVARFLPVGFYYRAFFRPKGIWNRIWEPIIRAKAGLGKVDTRHRGGYYDKAYGHYDVVVAGGGLAGMSAAISAAQHGASVLLVDENPILGGAMNYARADIKGKRLRARCAQLRQTIAESANITVMTDTVCNAWYVDHWLAVIKGCRLHKVRAKQFILAAGSLEQPAIFHNNDLPGVMMGSAAQRLMNLYGILPGKNAVVLTGNDDGYGVALELREAGAQVQIIEMRDLALAQATLHDGCVAAGLRIHYGSAIYAAKADRNMHHINGVEFGKIAGKGTIAKEHQQISCDLICMSVGYTPTYQLALQAGGKLGYDDDTAIFSIENLPKGFHLAGSLNGVFATDDVQADGQRAAAQALDGLEITHSLAADFLPVMVQVNHPWPIFEHPDDKNFVDFDEDLMVKDIRNAVKEGYNELELVKRFSTVGMGPSQGRHAALNAARLVAEATDRQVRDVGVTTARPPFSRETLGVMGGRVFSPERLTHHRHAELGGHAMRVGAWWRPGHYGVGVDRVAEINSEVRNVRENVGLIDVSTLGGLEILGADAAQFLNRVYTFAYLKQPIGRARYLLMTNEAGTVIDDGVACRMAEDRFYITATSSGVDRVCRQMLWLNAQWHMDINIINVTAAYGGMNLAGPNARKVLQKLVSDEVDISAEGFPYMGLREFQVAGIPAIVFRVGFVGELGYEIHVPATAAEYVWDQVLAVGQEFGIQPFGLET